jgi:hypothetical protein
MGEMGRPRDKDFEDASPRPISGEDAVGRSAPTDAPLLGRGRAGHSASSHTFRDRLTGRSYRIVANVQQVPAGDRHWQARDVDGNLISDLLGQHTHRNYGRRRVSATWRTNLPKSGLAAGTWRVEKAGTTGRPVGRPARGKKQPWKEVTRFALILVMDEPGKHLLGEQLALDGNINVAELSTRIGYSRMTVNRWRKRGQSLQNAPKDMENTQTPTLVERVARLEVDYAELRVQVRETARQVGIETDDARVVEAVELFLASIEEPME